MSLVVNRHQLNQALVNVNTDQVMAHLQMPPECKLVNMWGETHLIAGSAISVLNSGGYGIDGLVIPDADPGAIDLIDDLWDIAVTKDDDFSGGLDLDSFDSDVNPVYEPGEPNIGNVIGLQAIDETNRFYKKRKLITFASAPRGFEAGTPDTFVPADTFKMRSRANIEALYPSYAMIAVSAPAFDDTNVTPFSTFGTEAAWLQIKYLDMVLQQAFLDLVGLTEAGAETPYEEASALLEDLLEPTLFEEVGASFQGVEWTCFMQTTWQMVVPGIRDIKQISAA